MEYFLNWISGPQEQVNNNRGFGNEKQYEYFPHQTSCIPHTFRSQIWFMSSIWNSKELDFYNVDLEALCANAFTTPGELNNAGLLQ